MNHDDIHLNGPGDARREAPGSTLRTALGRASGWPDEIENMLRVGQVGSTAGVIDLYRQQVEQWTRGTPQDPPLQDDALLALSNMLFGRSALDAARLADAAKVVSALGGVRTVIVRLDGSDLFATALPGTGVVLLLVMKHRDRSPTGSDMTARAKDLSHALASSQGVGGGNERTSGFAEYDAGHAVSVAFWRRLVDLFSGRGRRASTRDGMPAAAPPVRGSRWRGSLQRFCKDNEYARFGLLVDRASGALLDNYAAREDVVPLTDVPAALVAAFDEACNPWPLVDAFSGEGSVAGKFQIQIGKRDFYWLRIPYFPSLGIPFDPDRVLVLYKRPRPNSVFDWHAIDQAGLDMLRNRVKALLANGLKTQIHPFPRTQHEFKAIIDQLVELPPDDLIGRLDVGGFADHPVRVDDIDLRCQECIYFLPNRRWCDLPELPVPVEADWYCRLWKI